MTHKIGIIGALQVEVGQLIEQLEAPRSISVANTTIYEGVLDTIPVAVMRCGVGKVGAALSTQALIDRCAPTHVINTGIAGSLDNSLDIGDLVVATDLVQHDMDVTGLGYDPGVIPDLDHAGQMAGKAFFETSAELQDIIMKAAAEVAPNNRAIRGRIASGDQFVCTLEARSRIVELFAASCCEMEGAAIAQVCWRNDVPFVVARTVSDKADGSSTVVYNQFEKETAHRCAAIVRRAIELLG